MINMETTMKNLNSRGFDATYFASAKEAADYIVSQLHGETVGFGGSKTVEALDVFERLAEANTVFWHWKQGMEVRSKATAADVYITSANAVAETGEIINIDGAGNRVAGTLFGKKKVYFIIGSNKIAEDYDKALWRARNIAAPLNARRFNTNTPCTKGDLKCHDCNSPERICKGLVVLWGKMMGMEKVEVVIIGEELGF
ncbi:lactate utilization protein [Dehalobacter sp. DCM]|uniref:lactate utilization protein n=1 Tax=Dehalobacter sp. DCM TaxID=2907827 RepID=UPI00308192B5|nr:lactate utilization protein [Dehalobacter sp. DCM]